MAATKNWGVLPKDIFDDEHDILVQMTKMQIFVASFTAITVTLLLRPLGIPPMISQILAGILLGPTALGRIPDYRVFVFPCNSFRSFLKVYTGVGIIFLVFLTGLQVDPSTVLKLRRNMIVVGFSVLAVPVAVTCASGIAISQMAGLNLIQHRELVFVGLAECISSFSMVTYYLHELKIINTEFSRIACSATMVSNLFCMGITVTIQVAINIKHGNQMGVAAVAFAYAHYLPMLLVVVVVLRPLVPWMDKQIMEGQPKEKYVEAVILSVVILSLICLVTEINIMYGPFLLGLFIPSGSQLGSALVKRLEPYNTWMVIPVFYTICGNEIDISRVKLTKALRIGLLVLFSHMGKFLGAFIPARSYNMSYTDATLLGLAVNAQGFIELLLFTEFKNNAFILNDTYAIMTVAIVILTGISMPIMRYLYSSSSVKSKGCNRKTIQHAKPQDELRVLACIHNEEKVRPILLLLKASNATRDSPIKVSIVHFVELIGLSTPLYISHKVRKNHPGARAPSSSHRIMNVFTAYEENKMGSLSVDPYTVITPYATMHSDVCKLALQKRTHLILLPFHDKIDDGISDTAIRMMNKKIFDNAPCSVGLFIDRGFAGDVAFATDRESTYKVAVIFLGGADDREALAYAARMSEHPNVAVSVYRFLKSDSECNYTIESLLDEEILSEFNLRAADNNRVIYKVHEVKNGLGMIKVVESMKDAFDLIMLGRQHSMSLPLILDLTEWDCSDLGTMADIFIESNYGGNATILVVQQHRRKTATKQARMDEDMQMQLKSQNYTRLKQEIPL